MKVMNKRRIKIRQSEDLCWNERRILEALGSPFVVSHARLLLGFVSTCHSLAYGDVPASTELFGSLLAFSVSVAAGCVLAGDIDLLKLVETHL